MKTIHFCTSNYKISFDVTFDDTINFDDKKFYYIDRNGSYIALSAATVNEIDFNLNTINLSSDSTGIFLLYKFNDETQNTTENKHAIIADNGYKANTKSIKGYTYFIFSTNGEINTGVGITKDITLTETIYVNPPYNPPVEDVETFNLIELSNLEKCSITPAEIVENEKTLITITPAENTNFQFTPTININGYTHDFNVENGIATYNYTDGKIKNINSVCVETTEIENNYGLITLYKADDNILSEIPNTILYYSENRETQIVDIPKYILNFFKLPLNLKSIGKKYISFNGVISGLYCDYIDSNILEYDFGDILVKGFYNNSIDFDSEVNLFLPYLETITLETNKVMDKTINLKYRIDVLTGDFIAIIKANNIVIKSITGNMSQKIPYMNINKNSDLTVNNKLDTTYLLNDKKPVITIYSETMIDNVNNSCNEYKKLNELTGYNAIDNIKLDSSSVINNDDLNSLIDVLKAGVIF